MSFVEFYNEYPKFNIDHALNIETALLHIFKQENIDKVINLNIILLTDDALLEINKSFLQHDYYTDIITFPIDITDELLEAELYISIDRIKDNALQNKVVFEHEFKRVLIHGVLHLCSYNDKTEEEIILMRSKENHYLNLECFT